MAERLKPKDGCYICGAEVTSKEHVPAKCFFPEESSFRKQLITVPSCKLHNEDTSSDDEYVRNFICVHHENNAIAYKQFQKKVIKSLTRNPKQFEERIKIQTPKGTVYAFNIKRDIFDRTIQKMAYAIFFHENKYQWNRGLIVLTEDLRNKDLSKDDYSQLLHTVMIKLPPSFDRGDNPKVFKYKILPSDQDKQNAIVQLTFYEGFTVWVTTQLDSKTYRV